MTFHPQYKTVLSYGTIINYYPMYVNMHTEYVDNTTLQITQTSKDTMYKCTCTCISTCYMYMYTHKLHIAYYINYAKILIMTHLFPLVGFPGRVSLCSYLNDCNILVQTAGISPSLILCIKLIESSIQLLIFITLPLSLTITSCPFVTFRPANDSLRYNCSWPSSTANKVTVIL